MKVVINKCFGGYGLSPLATIEYYKMKGQPCYIFKDDTNTPFDNRKYIPVGEDDGIGLFFTAFSVPNPNDFDHKELWDKYYLKSSPEDREDLDLIAVVEKLGSAANCSCASLSIVEIPDDAKGNYYIDEYDGNESIHENHRSW